MARVVSNRSKAVRSYKQIYNHREWANAAARQGGYEIYRAAPVDTGFLRSTLLISFFVDRKNRPSVRWEAIADYALYQEVGTGIYGPAARYITPVRAKALRWFDKGGNPVFARRVRGSKPKRYFRKGLERTFGKKNVVYYGVTGRGASR
jgi:hypothetical protein